MKQNVLSIYRSAGRLRVVSIDPLIDLDPVIARPRDGSAVHGSGAFESHSPLSHQPVGTHSQGLMDQTIGANRSCKPRC